MAVSEDALMWVEKYRPKTLDEVVGLKDIVDSLKAFMKNPKTMPHLMFAGVPGTGKTTLALAIAHTLVWAELEKLHIRTERLRRARHRHRPRPHQRLQPLQPHRLWRSHPIRTHHP